MAESVESVITEKISGKGYDSYRFWQIYKNSWYKLLKNSYQTG
jgi:hypothetical protein